MSDFETFHDDYGYEAKAARDAANPDPHEEKHGDAPTPAELRAEETK